MKKYNELYEALFLYKFCFTEVVYVGLMGLFDLYLNTHTINVGGNNVKK